MPQGRIGVVSRSPERLEIWIAKKKADPLPYQDHVRVPMNLKIGNNFYQAGLRSKPKVFYVWICPDLLDREGRKISLASALKEAGFAKNQKVDLRVDGDAVTVMGIAVKDDPDHKARLTFPSRVQGDQGQIPSVEELWHSQEERTWCKALDRYWDFVRHSNLELERELNTLDAEAIKHLDMQGWYDFLRYKYFRAKFTAPNRYATTTKALDWYVHNNALSDLYRIKHDLFSFDVQDIERGLKIAKRIRGLGTAGASGLLSILFPKHFGTVDQFAVKALRGVNSLRELKRLQSMNPEGLSVKDGMVLISIMRDKATQNNQQFSTEFWTPRKIDMILWTYGR